MLAGTCCASVGFSQTPISQIILDGNRTGRLYEGWGVVFSYAKLLYDYPEKERNDILDLLFLPNYGASLQVLKVAIGYDGNSDESCWQANKRSADDPGNYRRGYGGWLIEEARKRNPKIRLAALHWGYPAWATDDDLKARFIYEYVQGINESYGHLIEYIGGNQNESKITPEVTKKLRSLLNKGGLGNVKIIAADEGARVKLYSVIPSMKKDPEYAAAIDIIGIHFKGRPGNTDILENAFSLGKPIWSTEDGGGNYVHPRNGYSTIEQFLKLFLDARLTCAIRWLATSSHYDNMPWPSAGIIKANEPWSGYYKTGAIVWGIAHLTQFIQPGWKMIETDETFILHPKTNERVGRFAAYRNPETNDYSVIIRTKDSLPTNSKIRLWVNNLPAKELHVWESDFNRDESHWFVKRGTILASDQVFELEVQPGRVYTVSTTSGQNKAKTVSPAHKAFPYPYAENFDAYKDEELPKYFVNINSSFEIASMGANKVLKQVVRDAPLQWHYKSRPVSQPLTIVGDMNWSNYTVSVNAMLLDKGKIMLGGRFDGKLFNSGDFEAEGYWLCVDEKGQWRLLRKDTDSEEFVVLSSGQTGKSASDRWVKLSLSFKDNRISARIDEKVIAEVTDSVHTNGNVALAALSPETDNLFSATPTYPIVVFDELEVR